MGFIHQQASSKHTWDAPSSMGTWDVSVSLVTAERIAETSAPRDKAFPPQAIPVEPGRPVYRDNSPNPNHNSNEVTVRSLYGGFLK